MTAMAPVRRPHHSPPPLRPSPPPLPAGAFLVRYSATHPSCLVLCSVRADRSVRMQLFRRVEGGFQNLAPSRGETSEVYPRIMNYVKSCPEKFCTAVVRGQGPRSGERGLPGLSRSLPAAPTPSAQRPGQGLQ